MPWPDPDTLVAMPIEQRALAILGQLSLTGFNGRDNVVGGQVTQHWPGMHGGYAFAGQPRPQVDHQEFEQAASEAFDWLLVNGLVARDASQSSDNWVVVTQAGKEARLAEDPARALGARKLMALPLHARLAKAKRLFLAGEFEDAVLRAIKEVEIAVREAAGAEKTKIGTDLMALAFKAGEGPLRDLERPAPEQQGVMWLFMGAIAAFKNPSSHRQVDYDDPAEAVEVIYFADLLLRIVDRAAAA